MAVNIHLAAFLLLAILQSIRVVDSQCTSTSACADTCGRSGLQCCSCSGGSSLTQTCTCCPTGGACCRQTNGVTLCCPPGSTCSSTGTCVVPTVNLTSLSHSYCSSKSATTLRITVDNVMELYIDGNPITVARSHEWPSVKSVTLPANTQVIAVKATDYGDVAGILASTTDGTMITNAAWKCTATHVPAGNWMTPEYNDASWPAAVVSYKNLNAPTWGTLSLISNSAWWIWTGRRESNAVGFHPVAFCRYKCSACAAHVSGKKRGLEDVAAAEEKKALEQLSEDRDNQEDPEIPAAASEYEDAAEFSQDLGESEAAERGPSDDDPRWWRR